MRHQITAFFCLFLLCAPATAGDHDMQQTFSKVTEAGLLDPFYLMTTMEPPPSGEYILEGLRVDGRDDYHHIAGDGAGGALIRLHDGQLFYVSSEGQAAGVAPNLETFLSITLTLGGWVDALAFIKGDLASDQAEWAVWRAEWNIPSTPEDPAAAQAILDLLGIEPVTDPFAMLHQRIMSTKDIPVMNQHGSFESFARY